MGDNWRQMNINSWVGFYILQTLTFNQRGSWRGWRLCWGKLAGRADTSTRGGTQLAAPLGSNFERDRRRTPTGRTKALCCTSSGTAPRSGWRNHSWKGERLEVASTTTAPSLSLSLPLSSLWRPPALLSLSLSLSLSLFSLSLLSSLIRNSDSDFDLKLLD